ncbi:MAG: DUF523 domain-containing protein [Ignavibacteriales bacterium]
MYIVSACLAGINCRYDGKNSYNEKIDSLIKSGKAIPVCPEVLAGLGIPRERTEIKANQSGKTCVLSFSGKNLTKEFEYGAEKTLEIAKLIGADKAIMKSKSPSCGFGKIYDGTFSGTLIDGNGITCELLKNNGITVYTENDIDKLELDK